MRKLPIYPSSPPRTARTSTRSGKAEELLTSRVMSADGRESVLDGELLQDLGRKNAVHKRELNKLRHQTIERNLHKRKLEDQYASLLKNAQDSELHYSETRLNALLHESFHVVQQLDSTNLDHAVFSHMLDRERRQQLQLAKETEDVKGQLRKADELAAVSAKVHEGLVSPSQAGTAVDSLGDWEEIEALKQKVERAQQQYAMLTNQILQSRQRLKTQQEAKEKERAKELRLMQTIRQLQATRAHYEMMIEKLIRYAEEYERQHAKLRAVCACHTKDDLVARKDHFEIMKQTERNSFHEQLARFSSLRVLEGQLRKELNTLKGQAKERQRTPTEQSLREGTGQRTADCLAYTRGLSQVRQVRRLVDEKQMLAKEVIHGLNHLIARLRKCDILCEAGPWEMHNPTVELSDVDSPSARYSLSQLLLLMEGKICIYYLLAWQKNEHRKQLANNGFADDELVVIQYPTKKSKPGQDTTASPNGSPVSAAYRRQLTRRDTTLMSPTKPIAGRAIPPMVGRAQPFRGEAGMDLEGEGVVAKRHVDEQNHQVTLECLPNSPGDLNMHLLRDQILQQMAEARRRHARRQAEPAVTEDPEDPKVLSEERKRSTKFKDGRTKCKLERQRRQAEELAQEGLENVQKKRRVTELTVQIEKEMADRPPAMVHLATDTFDALEKIAKSLANERPFRQVKDDLGLLPSSMPNFVNAILKLRSARKGEHIAQVAKKCHYFPHDPTHPPRGSGSRPVSERGHREGIMNLEQRLKNLRSFQQMESLPPSFGSAFDAFYHRERINSPDRQPVKSSPRPQSQPHALSLLRKARRSQPGPTEETFNNPTSSKQPSLRWTGFSSPHLSSGSSVFNKNQGHKLTSPPYSGCKFFNGPSRRPLHPQALRVWDPMTVRNAPCVNAATESYRGSKQSSSKRSRQLDTIRAYSSSSMQN